MPNRQSQTQTGPLLPQHARRLKLQSRPLRYALHCDPLSHDALRDFDHRPLGARCEGLCCIILGHENLPVKIPDQVRYAQPVHDRALYL